MSTVERKRASSSKRRASAAHSPAASNDGSTACPRASSAAPTAVQSTAARRPAGIATLLRRAVEVLALDDAQRDQTAQAIGVDRDAHLGDREARRRPLGQEE